MKDTYRNLYYTAMALAMGICFFMAIIFQAGSQDKNALDYQYMAPALRASEYDALVGEVAGRLTSADQYFRVLYRIERLHDACMRADQEEKDRTKVFAAREMVLSTDFLSGNWQEKLRTSSIPESAEFKLILLKAREDANNPANGRNHPIRFNQDPRATLCWFLFYFGSMPLIMIHYAIRLRDMRCRVWPEVISNWKMPLWVALWPIGLFKYPREINPAEQVKLMWKRVQGFATLLVSSSISLFAFAVGATAQTEDPDHVQKNTLHIDASTTTWTKYLGSNGAIFHTAPVQQSGFTVSAPKGFSFGAWNSVPLADFNPSPNFGYEVDLYAGWTGKVKGFILSPGMRYICTAPLGQIHGDAFKYFGGISRGFTVTKHATISPYLLAERTLPVKGATPKAGVFLHGGIAQSWKSKHRIGIDSNIELLHDTGAFGFDPGYLAVGNATVSVRLSKGMILQLPNVSYSDPLTHMTDGRRPQLIFGAGLTYHH